MKGFKLVLAVAMFVTSVTFEEQIIVTDQGLASTWEVSVGTPRSLAVYHMEFE